MCIFAYIVLNEELWYFRKMFCIKNFIDLSLQYLSLIFTDTRRKKHFDFDHSLNYSSLKETKKSETSLPLKFSILHKNNHKTVTDSHVECKISSGLSQLL